MNRILGRVTSFLVAGLAMAAAIPACAKNDESIFIHHVLAPSSNRQNGVCVYTNDPESPGLFQATLDVGVRDDYFAILLVGNQLIARGDPNRPSAEADRVHLNGVVVRLTSEDGTQQLSNFTSYSTGIADVQNNNTPGYGLIGASVVDAPTAQALAKQLTSRTQTTIILANLKVFGETLGGTDLESNEFQLPISVCNGCLVSYAGANDPTQNPQPNCLKALDTSGATTLPCYGGQDESTPCQLCLARPICTAVP